MARLVSMEQTGGTCLLCGAAEKELLTRQGEWSVYRCKQCGLGILLPRPSEAELDALYRNSYFVEQYDEGAAPGSEAMRKRLSSEKHRIRFFRPFLKSGRILDIGCGRGYFLLACRESEYEVEGFDVSEDVAEYVRNTLKIPVTTGKPESASFEDGSFDAVTMWHSLEHTENPRTCLDSAHRWLRPGGLLVVDVPNYSSTDALKNGEQWCGWQLPYHFFHFTPGSLEKLLEQCGFEVIRRKSYHSEWVRERLRRIPVVSLFARLVAKLFSGTSYAVVARKVALPGTQARE
jgi:SAM-dependent methyltransferase